MSTAGKTLRVGVIGLGPIGNKHASIYQALPNVELVGVCDWKRERADAAAARYGVPAYTDAETMFREARPDSVSVTTGGVEYGSEHHLPTIQALRAGVHVLGEKPISNDIDEAEEMVALARAQGLCYGINMNHRFTPAARLAKQWMDEGRIGHLLFMNMSMWIMNPRESSPWFQIKALHPHTVDIMRHFCGDIETVHCNALKAPGRTIWSTAQFNMRFTCGALGHLTGSYDIQRGHPMERCEVTGIDGRFVIEDMFREVTLFPAGDLVKRVYTNPVFGGMGSFDDTFRNRIARFTEQVLAGDAPEAIDGSGADGLAAQQVLAAAIESIRSGQNINVREFCERKGYRS